jgi:hypothetical protein
MRAFLWAWTVFSKLLRSGYAQGWWVPCTCSMCYIVSGVVLCVVWCGPGDVWQRESSAFNRGSLLGSLWNRNNLPWFYERNTTGIALFHHVLYCTMYCTVLCVVWSVYPDVMTEKPSAFWIFESEQCESSLILWEEKNYVPVLPSFLCTAHTNLNVIMCI